MLVMTFLLAVINISIAGYVLGDIIVPTNLARHIGRAWIRFVFHLSMSIYFLLAIKAASVVVQ
jgi:hypothetical protein